MPFYHRPEVREAENKLTEQLARLINAAQLANGAGGSASPEVLSRAFRSILKDPQISGDLATDKEMLEQLKQDMMTIIMPMKSD